MRTQQLDCYTAKKLLRVVNTFYKPGAFVAVSLLSTLVYVSIGPGVFANYTLNFTGKNYAGLKIDEPSLRGANFEYAQLDHSDFSEQDLRTGRFVHASGRNAIFRGAKLSEADLSDSDFFGSDFAGAMMQNVKIQRAEFQQTRLQRVDVSGGDFLDTDFSGADLSASTLVRSYFQGANLSRSTLANSDLSESDLNRANLSGANLFSQ